MVIYSEAHEDIFRNIDWWATNHSLNHAIHWQDTVYSQLEDRKDLPERSFLAAESEDFPLEIREAYVGLDSQPRYLALFTIQNDAIHILTVWDAARSELKLEGVQLRKE